MTEELKHIAAWVRERFPEGYLLTWLLTQPGLWWCDGEVYQAALLKDGDRLKSQIQKNESSFLLDGITDKLTQDENWEAVAASLTRIFEVYQEELAILQEQRRQREARLRQALPKSWGASPTAIEDSLPTGDTLTGHQPIN
ncbi:MAG TPA: hypothetical protein IGS52_22360 [Oscillatoriaceae cyanobacterium M33_DOE_052]|uniref:Uncharacterized protein n=1 Tax=Planktothricoides sp. SpSt-374 TaxID=2282167 RepID=A0A7C3ZK35_9CYAN|nr:hypothetical protein [Oscillatoriaceae cyanobacterium M33_DOE_052]